VSSDEFTPLPQTAKQKEVEARIKEWATGSGVSRRRLGRTNLRYGFVVNPTRRS
jgi:hypothetical protein